MVETCIFHYKVRSEIVRSNDRKDNIQDFIKNKQNNEIIMTIYERRFDSFNQLMKFLMGENSLQTLKTIQISSEEEKK